MISKQALLQSFLLFILILTPCIAFADSSVQDSENYYVQPNEVYVTPNGIYILFEKELYPINILCADEKGVYVPASEMNRRFVRCPHCGRWYDPKKGHKNCKGP